MTEEEIKKPEKKLEGLCGWIVFPIIGMIIELFISIPTTLNNLFIGITDFGFFAFPSFFIGQFLSFVFVFVTLLCIFLKRKLGKSLAIIKYGLDACLLLLYGFFGDIAPELLIAGVIGSLIWCMYFIFSRRVENTLVN